MIIIAIYNLIVSYAGCKVMAAKEATTLVKIIHIELLLRNVMSTKPFLKQLKCKRVFGAIMICLCTNGFQVISPGKGTINNYDCQ